MKCSTLIVGGLGCIVLFTIVLPAILSLVLAGEVLAEGIGGTAWLLAMRLSGQLIVSTISGRGWF